MDIITTIEPTADAAPPAGRPRHLALWITLGVIAAATAAALLAMGVAARASARDHHTQLVQSVLAAQQKAIGSQLGLADPDRDALAVALGDVDSPDLPRVTTDVLTFEPGHVVTRSTVESDGYLTQTLMDVRSEGGGFAYGGCVTASTAMEPTCPHLAP